MINYIFSRKSVARAPVLDRFNNLFKNDIQKAFVQMLRIKGK